MSVFWAHNAYFSFLLSQNKPKRGYRVLRDTKGRHIYSSKQNTRFEANSVRQLTKLTHSSDLKQNAITTQKLVVLKLTRLKEKEKGKGIIWMTVCLIHSHKKERRSSKLLPITMLCLPSQCRRFIPLILQASLTNAQTLSLSGCLICLGSHPTANQTRSFILSNPSCRSLSSCSPHPLTDLSYQILSCSAQLPALQLTH